MSDSETRAETLAGLGAGPRDIELLLDYTANRFHAERVGWPVTLPLESEPHVAMWQEYADSVRRAGSIAPLAAVFPQLCFPIEANISASPAYTAATRRGERGDSPAALRLGLRRPDDVAVELHDTVAGTVPLVIVRDREDFVTLVRAFTRRNEPSPVPDAQGACLVAGYNNWDRVRRYRSAWEASAGAEPEGWGDEFRRLAACKELYQDRFVLLSDGPYSAVPAAAMALGDAEWRDASLVIRREHECAHYFTKRVFGAMNNLLHDELLADYAGIAAACGAYRGDWFLRFMGLEGYPGIRAGGRLENYRGDPPLPATAFAVLQSLVVRVTRALSGFCDAHAETLRDVRERAVLLIALASLSLVDLGRDDGIDRLARAHATAAAQVRWVPGS